MKSLFVAATFVFTPSVVETPEPPTVIVTQPRFPRLRPLKKPSVTVIVPVNPVPAVQK